jgi:hypothetical protein
LEDDLTPLLDLDGSILEMGEGYWVKIDAKVIPAEVGRPAGIAYSLSLHDPNGNRLVGYDNAHPVKTGTGPAARREPPNDHRHSGERVRPYPYTNAVTLLGDFWAEVERVLKEEGIP